MVEYAYDPWGKLLESRSLKTECEKLSKLNPFRYRGYVWDDESGYYYLRSRYYQPQLERFINADKNISIARGLMGTNFFIYCENNPISRYDPSGNVWVYNGIRYAYDGSMADFHRAEQGLSPLAYRRATMNAPKGGTYVTKTVQGNRPYVATITKTSKYVPSNEIISLKASKYDESVNPMAWDATATVGELGLAVWSAVSKVVAVQYLGGIVGWVFAPNSAWGAVTGAIDAAHERDVLDTALKNKTGIVYTEVNVHIENPIYQQSTSMEVREWTTYPYVEGERIP